ncbi:transcription antitermination factor NusB [Schaalia sp. 19OD2882]|uniref:transcription antitermination factor NusB n=1 Tax=Schaalia sp. 19OD2882 TaxID=2794089 RepID=UPI001C1ED32B|nr:transcription antitermination factor NusB [Schaalia sp. 19OD2882]QWW18713.1 transcription antitermination factor NusB [Schaalia sp. 19OD2882]
MSKKYSFTSRTKARKRAADVVFEADQRGMGRDPEVLRDLLRERKVVTAALTPLPDYSIRIVEGVADNLSRIDHLIAAHANVPGLDRVAAVDLAVMRVAVWEMLANTKDVPAVTAIDEAISIVKSISTDSSAGFVNAVLDAVRRELDAPAWSRQPVGSPAEEDSSESPFEEPVGPDEGGDVPRGEGGEDGKRHLRLEDITAADLAELDELFDEY